MTDGDVTWVVLVRTGSTSAFTEVMARFVKPQGSALLATWVLGIFMFVDDYLNSLADCGFPDARVLVM